MSSTTKIYLLLQKLLQNIYLDNNMIFLHNFSPRFICDFHSLIIYFFQITNGESDLSSELSQQLLREHNCHVILVTSSSSQTNATAKGQSTRGTSKDSRITKYSCNILNNIELAKLTQWLDDEYGGIDVVIENNSDLKSNQPTGGKKTDDDCIRFIDDTSNNIRSTINVRFFCVLPAIQLVHLTVYLFSLISFAAPYAFHTKNEIFNPRPFCFHSNPSNCSQIIY